ncbi:unnamed protein product [Sphagnum tenellum]
MDRLCCSCVQYSSTKAGLYLKRIMGEGVLLLNAEAEVSCYSSVEDAVAGDTAQPQQLLVPPAWCRHVPILPELRRWAVVLELWDLQSITQ